MRPHFRQSRPVGSVNLFLIGLFLVGCAGVPKQAAGSVDE